MKKGGKGLGRSSGKLCFNGRGGGGPPWGSGSEGRLHSTTVGLSARPPGNRRRAPWGKEGQSLERSAFAIKTRPILTEAEKLRKEKRERRGRGPITGPFCRRERNINIELILDPQGRTQEGAGQCHSKARLMKSNWIKMKKGTNREGPHAAARSASNRGPKTSDIEEKI